MNPEAMHAPALQQGGSVAGLVEMVEEMYWKHVCECDLKCPEIRCASVKEWNLRLEEAGLTFWKPQAEGGHRVIAEDEEETR